MEGVGQRETSIAAEARAVTAAESTRAFPESVGDQGHTIEGEERAEKLAERKPRKEPAM